MARWHRQVRWTLLTAIWLGVVTWAWSYCAPIVPDRVVPFERPNDHLEICEVTNGQVKIARGSEIGDEGTEFSEHPGVLEFWDLKTGTKVQELKFEEALSSPERPSQLGSLAERVSYAFSQQGGVHCNVFSSNAETIDGIEVTANSYGGPFRPNLQRSGSSYLLIDVAGTSPLDEFECEETITDASLSAHRRLAVFTTNKRVFVRDLQRHCELWSHEDLGMCSFVTEEYLKVHTNVYERNIAKGWIHPQILDAHTGEAIEDLDDSWQEVVSLHGDRLLGLTHDSSGKGSHWILVDTCNKKTLWELPVPDSVRFIANYDLMLPVFEDEATLAIRTWGIGQLRTERYAVLDGQLLGEKSPLPNGALLTGVDQWQAVGRIAAFVERHSTDSPLFYQLQKLYDRHIRSHLRSLPALPRYVKMFPSLVLYDQTSAREVARLEGNWFVSRFDLLDEQHVVVIAPDGLKYYSIPPHRSWSWWLGPAVAPCGVWLAIRWLRQRMILGRWKRKSTAGPLIAET